MSFSEFCEKVNSDDEYRSEYLKHPVALVKKDLEIPLTSEQERELEEAVKELKKAVPNFKLYVAGSKFHLDGGNGQLH